MNKNFYTVFRQSVFTLFFIAFVVMAPAILIAQDQEQMQKTVLLPSEFGKIVIKNSTEAKLLSLQSQIARKTKELSLIKLKVPSLDFKFYPFGYDSRRTNTFISQYAYNPGAASHNPLVFSGLQQYGIDSEYYNFGSGLDFKSLTPFGGFIGFGLDHFFLIDKTFEEYRQRIKFDFTLSQPLFGKKILDNFSFFSQSRIIDNKYQLSEIEKEKGQNEIILGAYKQAYGLISLQKQKIFLEKTVNVLQNDLNAMKVRLNSNVVSPKNVQVLEVALAQKKQLLRDVIESYNNTRGKAEQAIAAVPNSLIIQDVVNLPENVSFEEIAKSHKMTDNFSIKSKLLEYDIANKGIFFKGIGSKPQLNFNLSVQPRYPQPRENEGDFLSSFTDFSAEGSAVDVLFTVEFQMPLLTKLERQKRHSLDTLSVEANRLAYEKELENKKYVIENLNEKYENAQKKIYDVSVEKSLQELYMKEKKIQFDAGSISRQELLRQELQLQNAYNKEWEAKKELFIIQFTILNEKGVALSTLL